MQGAFRSAVFVGFVLLVSFSGSSSAAVRFQGLVIGNNEAFSVSERKLPPLRYADDDAAAFFEMLQSKGADAHLLTVLDRDTQIIFPRLASLARVPTLKELNLAVDELAEGIRRNRRDGHRTVLFVFFSGHGSVSEDRAPDLALFDGGLTQDVLYNDVLQKLPADSIHLIVDACHAEAVVRPRDTEGKVVRVSSSESETVLVQSTLARFPNVGAIVAAAGNARSHEWDALRHGVFTHELLSGLSGAADVNRDGKIEYSEIYAFLSAANRQVADVRAHLDIVARPPNADRRSVLWDWDGIVPGKGTRLTGIPGRSGVFRIENGTGRILATLHGEPGFAMDVVVPSGQRTYVRNGEREAHFDAQGGADVAFDRLVFVSPSERERGALEDSLGEGLFAAEFGPRYYAGFVDQTHEFLAVQFTAIRSAPESSETLSVRSDHSDHAPSNAGRRLAFGVGIGRPIAQNLDTTSSLLVGIRPATRSGPILSLDLFRASETGLAESRASISIGFNWPAHFQPVTFWFGLTGGTGVVVQQVAARAPQWSGLLSAGPNVGASIDVTPHLGAWVEAQMLGMAYRREGASAVALDPSVRAGLSLAL